MSKTTELASGHITTADTLTVEVVEPTDSPLAVRIRWPEKPSITSAAGYDQVASNAMRILANAVIKLAILRRERKLCTAAASPTLLEALGEILGPFALFGASAFRAIPVDPSSLGKKVVSAVGDVAEFLDGLIEVATFSGVAHRSAVKSDIEKLVLSRHASMYRTVVRLR
jgi:hypothetical protein